MILIYITCESKKQAEKIGNHLLKKRLAACINIFPEIKSVYWLPKINKLESAKEAVLLVKTRDENYKEIGREVKKLHSYTVPCIFSIKVDKANKPYLDWLMKEKERG